jgi:hypothetical protein
MDLVGQILLVIILTVIMYVTMRVREIRKRGIKLFLLVLLIQSTIFFTFYFANYQQLNIIERIYFKAYDEVEYQMGREHFWYSKYYHYSEGHDSTENYVYIFPYEDVPIEHDDTGLYIYDLTKELWNMEAKIDTFDENPVHLFQFEGNTYLVTKAEANNDIVTKIYDVNEYEKSLDLLHTFMSDFDVYPGLDNILLVEQLPDSVSKVYYLSGESEYTFIKEGPYIITNIYPYGSYLYIERDSIPGIDLWEVNDHFEDVYLVVDGLHDYATYSTGFDRLLIFDTIQTHTYHPPTKETTVFEWNLHYDGASRYLDNMHIYDLDFNIVGNDLYIDQQGYVAGENRAYLTTDDRMIVFNNEKLVELHFVPVQSGIFIPGYTRHILGIVSLFLGSILYTYGLRKPPVHIAKSHIYQVTKMSCKKCGADNNIVTFPYICDYCNSYQFTNKN